MIKKQEQNMWKIISMVATQFAVQFATKGFKF
jgi:hypothetical protein